MKRVVSLFNAKTGECFGEFRDAAYFERRFAFAGVGWSGVRAEPDRVRAIRRASAAASISVLSGVVHERRDPLGMAASVPALACRRSGRPGFAGALRLNGYAVAGSHGPQDQGAVHQGLRSQAETHAAVLKAHNARPAQAAGLSRRDHRRERGEMPGLP